ncbi:MAG TPA: hypothetical protein VGB66_19235, partial [Longimicrobium sp.]
ALVVPEAVSAGVPFTITVATFGSSTCTRAAGAEVRTQGSVAEVVPYDYVATDGVCTADLRSFPRGVQLRFASAGPGVVRVRGVNGSGAEVVIERTVTVR